MTFETWTKYSEDSIQSTREILGFLKKKAQLDAEYSRTVGTKLRGNLIRESLLEPASS
jgi:hypothetical protein